MHESTLVAAELTQALAQTTDGAQAPMVLLLVFVGLLMLVFWRQILMMAVAVVFAVFAYGLLQAISTMQQ